MISLENKVALITGGSRGIGASCVELFVEAGAGVAFTYKSNKAAADELIGRLDKEGSRPLRAYSMDMESEKDIHEKVRQVISDFGRIDILVNNAGIWKYGAADEMSLKDWEETISINLTGTFIITKAVIPEMKKNGFGRIINISSTAGQRGEAFHSHYAASKGALISYTKSLASELARFNITTNCVAPGWVITDLSQEVFSDKKYKESVEQDIPVGRIADPVDIAGPVVFLASGLARHINGEILNVNGGSILCG
ncbi:MAG: 3-oxoacyl-ACP reductase FabG [Ignavibacteria bacterium]|jgi:3-oxoacyl-[acyl-carrier protein] reductase|nr:3-oxoacyl-ACP reductase FabG [Ignavibacteria bacterium]MCU7502386.1 3-oxoacyl-ACP reductase FabG [Ignavibacteria bacterium]MCU7515049.1 3-oxoacyl-ACP reductase FabG [Ignavibacteria bacterium]